MQNSPRRRRLKIYSKRSGGSPRANAISAKLNRQSPLGPKNTAYINAVNKVLRDQLKSLKNFRKIRNDLVKATKVAAAATIKMRNGTIKPTTKAKYETLYNKKHREIVKLQNMLKSLTQAHGKK